MGRLCVIVLCLRLCRRQPTPQGFDSVAIRFSLDRYLEMEIGQEALDSRVGTPVVCPPAYPPATQYRTVFYQHLSLGLQGGLQDVVSGNIRSGQDFVMRGTYAKNLVEATVSIHRLSIFKVSLFFRGIPAP
jgi:hypothetical protein